MDEVITLRLRSQFGDEILFKFRRATKMQKIFAAYSSKRGVPEENLRFYLDGERIYGDSTAESLELEDSDVVDVYTADESVPGEESYFKSGRESQSTIMRNAIVGELEEILNSNLTPHNARDEVLELCRDRDGQITQEMLHIAALYGVDRRFAATEKSGSSKSYSYNGVSDEEYESAVYSNVAKSTGFWFSNATEESLDESISMKDKILGTLIPPFAIDATVSRIKKLRPSLYKALTTDQHVLFKAWAKTKSKKKIAAKKTRDKDKKSSKPKSPSSYDDILASSALWRTNQGDNSPSETSLPPVVEAEATPPNEQPVENSVDSKEAQLSKLRQSLTAVVLKAVAVGTVDAYLLAILILWNESVHYEEKMEISRKQQELTRQIMSEADGGDLVSSPEVDKSVITLPVGKLLETIFKPAFKRSSELLSHKMVNPFSFSEVVMQSCGIPLRDLSCMVSEEKKDDVVSNRSLSPQTSAGRASNAFLVSDRGSIDSSLMAEGTDTLSLFDDVDDPMGADGNEDDNEDEMLAQALAMSLGLSEAEKVVEPVKSEPVPVLIEHIFKIEDFVTNDECVFGSLSAIKQPLFVQSLYCLNSNASNRSSLDLNEMSIAQVIIALLSFITIEAENNELSLISLSNNQRKVVSEVAPSINPTNISFMLLELLLDTFIRSFVQIDSNSFDVLGFSEIIGDVPVVSSGNLSTVEELNNYMHIWSISSVLKLLKAHFVEASDNKVSAVDVGLNLLELELPQDHYVDYAKLFTSSSLQLLEFGDCNQEDDATVSLLTSIPCIALLQRVIIACSGDIGDIVVGNCPLSDKLRVFSSKWGPYYLPIIRALSMETYAAALPFIYNTVDDRKLYVYKLLQGVSPESPDIQCIKGQIWSVMDISWENAQDIGSIPTSSGYFKAYLSYLACMSVCRWNLFGLKCFGDGVINVNKDSTDAFEPSNQLETVWASLLASTSSRNTISPSFLGIGGIVGESLSPVPEKSKSPFSSASSLLRSESRSDRKTMFDLMKSLIPSGLANDSVLEHLCEALSTNESAEVKKKPIKDFSLLAHPTPNIDTGESKDENERKFQSASAVFSAYRDIIVPRDLQGVQDSKVLLLERISNPLNSMLPKQSRFESVDRNIFYGELCLYRLYQIQSNFSFAKSCTSASFSRSSVLEQASLVWDTDYCSGNLDCSGDDSTTVIHRGPKAWCSVLAQTGFEPNSGVHEWQVRVNRCDKGHLFIGVATQETVLSSYIGGNSNSWGLIGTRALWHNHIKIRSDYGDGFGSGGMNVITARLDTNTRTLSFYTANSDWGVAFKNLPSTVLYPAVSLYIAKDSATIITKTASVAQCGISRDRALRISEQSKFIKDVHDIFNKFNALIHQYESSGTVSDLVFHPFFAVVLPSLLATASIAFSVSTKFISFPVCQTIPYFTFMCRKLSQLHDIVNSATIYKSNSGIYPLVDGNWSLKSTSSSGSVVKVDENPYNLIVSLNTKENTDNIQSVGLSGVALSLIGHNAAVIGAVSGSRWKFVELWDAGSSCVVEGRVSLDGGIFWGKFRSYSGSIATAIDSSSTGNTFGVLSTMKQVISHEVLGRCAGLCAVVCGKGIAAFNIGFPLHEEPSLKSVDSVVSIGSVKQEDLEMKEETESQPTAQDLPERLRTEEQKWISSELLSGGFSTSDLDLKRFIAKRCMEMLVTDYGDESEAKTISNMIPSPLKWWFESVFMTLDELQMNLKEYDVSKNGKDSEIDFIIGISGSNQHFSLDEYVIHHVGTSPFMKVCGSDMQSTRKCVLAALIKHSGCSAFCKAEYDFLIKKSNGRYDRNFIVDEVFANPPAVLLVEIWRAAQRVVEFWISQKNPLGISSYSEVAAMLEQRASFLLSLDVCSATDVVMEALGTVPLKLVTVSSELLIRNISCKESDEEGVGRNNIPQIESECSRLLANAASFLMASPQNVTVSRIQREMLSSCFKAVCRIAGFKTFSLLCGKPITITLNSHVCSVSSPCSLTLQAICSEYLVLSLNGLLMNSADTKRNEQFEDVKFALDSKIVKEKRGHYKDGLHACSKALVDEIRRSFFSAYEYLTQLLQRGKWANDMDGQCVTLACWGGLSVEPEDHVFLNRAGIFRILQEILDASREVLLGMSARMIEIDNDSSAIFSRILHFSGANRLSQLALRIVHSLASQVAALQEGGIENGKLEGPSRGVSNGIDNPPLPIPLRRLNSGPETLSSSLFDLLYAELFNSLKSLIVTAVQADNVDLSSSSSNSTKTLSANSQQVVLAASLHISSTKRATPGETSLPDTLCGAVSRLINNSQHNDASLLGENYICRMLRLLHSVANTKACQKCLCTPKWLSLLIASVGCGSVGVQRRLLKLLRRLLLSSNPSNIKAFVTSLYSSREEYCSAESVLEDGDIDSLVSLQDNYGLEDVSDLGSVPSESGETLEYWLSSKNSAERILVMLLEGISIIAPATQDMFDCSGLVTSLQKSNLISLLSGESLALIRILQGSSDWRSVIDSVIKKQLLSYIDGCGNNASDESIKSYDTMKDRIVASALAVLGGYVDRFYMGGIVNLRPFSLVGASEAFSLKIASVSHSSAMIVAKDETSVEVVLMELGMVYSTVKDQCSGEKKMVLQHTTSIPASLPVKTVRLNANDVSPTYFVPALSDFFSPDVLHVVVKLLDVKFIPFVLDLISNSKDSLSSTINVDKFDEENDSKDAVVLCSDSKTRAAFGIADEDDHGADDDDEDAYEDEHYDDYGGGEIYGDDYDEGKEWTEDSIPRNETVDTDDPTHPDTTVSDGQVSVEEVMSDVSGRRVKSRAVSEVTSDEKLSGRPVSRSRSMRDRSKSMGDSDLNSQTSLSQGLKILTSTFCFKAFCNAMQSSALINYFVNQAPGNEALAYFDVFRQLLNISVAMTSCGGVAVVEEVEMRWNAVWDAIVDLSGSPHGHTDSVKEPVPVAAPARNISNASKPPTPIPPIVMSRTSSESAGSTSFGGEFLPSVLLAPRQADPTLVAQMLEMGLPQDWCEFALRRCRNNVAMAINFCFEQSGDMDQLIAEEATVNQQMQARARAQASAAAAAAASGATPPSVPAGGRRIHTFQSSQGTAAGSANRLSQIFSRILQYRAAPRSEGDGQGPGMVLAQDANMLMTYLMELGIPPHWCLRALAASGGNVDGALQWISTHSEELLGEMMRGGNGGEVPPAPATTRGVSVESDQELLNDFMGEMRGQPSSSKETTSDSKPTTPLPPGVESIINPLVCVSGNVNIENDLTCTFPVGNSRLSGGFPSVGCRGFPVFSGKWYYEVTVVSAKCVQIGWADLAYVGASDQGEGVGDDCHSWSYDGWRRYAWHERSKEWGSGWVAGDVVGCAVDFEAGTISYYLNGFGEEIGMGVAFNSDSLGEMLGGLYPCVSFNKNEVIKFNFGESGFKHVPPEGYSAYIEHVKIMKEKYVANSKNLNYFYETISKELNRAQESTIPAFYVEDCMEEHRGDGETFSNPVGRYFADAASAEPTTVKFPNAVFDSADVPSITAKCNSVSSKKKALLAQFSKLSKDLCVLYSRIALTRILCGCATSQPFISKLLGASDMQREIESHIVYARLLYLIRLSGLYSSRTRAYLQTMSLLPTNSLAPVNLGSILCAGGLPTLYMLRESALQLVQLSVKGSNHSFISEVLNQIQLDTARAALREFMNSFKYDNNSEFVVHTTGQGVLDSACLTTPDLGLAFYWTAILIQSFSKLAREVDIEAVYQWVVRIFQYWCTSLQSPAIAVKLTACRVLSTIIQDVAFHGVLAKIVCSSSFRLDNNLEISEGTGILSSLRRILPVERLERIVRSRMHYENMNIPLCSEYLQALLELVGSADVYLPSTAPAPIESIVDSQQQGDDRNFTFNWESNSGHIFADEGWFTWTGTVRQLQSDWSNKSHISSYLKQDADSSKKSPKYVLSATNVERQDLAPELLPGCRVIRKRKKSTEPERKEEPKSPADERTALGIAVTPPQREAQRSIFANLLSELSGGSVEGDIVSSILRAREPVAEAPSSAEAAKLKEEVPDPVDESNGGVVIALALWKGSSDATDTDTLEKGVFANARVVRWDDGSKEVVRWGAEGCFDVTQTGKGSGKSGSKVYAPPVAEKTKAADKLFATDLSFGIIVRLRLAAPRDIEGKLYPSNHFDDITGDEEGVIAYYDGVVEYPDFNSIVYVVARKYFTNYFEIEEKHLISLGSGNSTQWTARFGHDEWQPVTYSFYPSEKSDPLFRKSNLLDSYSGQFSYTVKFCEPEEEVEVVGDIRIQQEALFTFDPYLKNKNFTISHGGSMISNNTGGGRGLAFGSVGFSIGVHYWEFKVEHADMGSIFLGVSEKPLPGNNATGFCPGVGFSQYMANNCCVKWYGQGFINHRSSYKRSISGSSTERMSVYGDHFQINDTVGVLLDLNKGKLYFFLDGMKYGEHSIQDLGEAFDGLRASSTAALRKVFYPVVGFQKPQDRVVITPRWLSTIGTNSGSDYKLFTSAYRLLSSWSVERPSSAPLQGDMWLYREAWRDWIRWLSGRYIRVRARCHATNTMILLDTLPVSCVGASIQLGLCTALFHGDRILFTRSCGKVLDIKEEAVILGTYKGMLWYRLDSQANGLNVVEGPTLAWFLAPSDVEGLQILKRAVGERNLGDICEIPLPRLPSYKGGLVTISYDGNAVMRNGMEIDAADAICTLSTGTVLYATEKRTNSSNIVRYHVVHENHYGWISERMRGGSEDIMVSTAVCTAEELQEAKAKAMSVLDSIYDSSGMVGLGLGIGALERSDTVQEVKCVAEGVEMWLAEVRKRNIKVNFRSNKVLVSRHAEFSSNLGSDLLGPFGVLTGGYFPNAEVAHFDNEVNELSKTKPTFAAVLKGVSTKFTDNRKCFAEVIKGYSFEDFVGLASTMNEGPSSRNWSLEADVMLVDIISRCAQKERVTPLNLSAHVLELTLEGYFSGEAAVAYALLRDVPARKLLARAALMRTANQAIGYSLPYMSLSLPEEKIQVNKRGVEEELLYSPSNTAMPDVDVLKKPNSEMIKFPAEMGIENTFKDQINSYFPVCGARRLRTMRRVLFFHTKKLFWEAVLDATATNTAMPQDEYEDPRELKTLKINRVKSTVTQLANISSTHDRIKQSIFGQLHRELRNWNNSNFRRAYIGKGHGGQKRAFKVKFQGEGVNDYGGPYRAVFESLIEELQADNSLVGHKVSERCLLPLFVPCPNRSSTIGVNQDQYVISPAPTSPLIQELMQFFGKLVGVSIRHNLTLGFSASSMFYRPLVKMNVGRVHLESIDSLITKQLSDMEKLGLELEQLLRVKISGAMLTDEDAAKLPSEPYDQYQPEDWKDFAFTTYLSDGTRVALIPNGESVPVTLGNWREFCALVEKIHVKEGVLMFKALRDGINCVVPTELFPIFTSVELEEMIGGSRSLDVNLLRQYSEYDEVLAQSLSMVVAEPVNSREVQALKHQQLVKNFWEVLEEFSGEERTEFLKFVWARSRMPSSISEMTMNFKLQLASGSDDLNDNPDKYLPSAQTCFFSLALPCYTCKEVLAQKLLYAIMNSPTMDADVRLHSAEGWAE